MSHIRHLPVAPTQTQACTAGEVIDAHRHDEHQLVYVSTGVLAITTEHGTWVAARERGVWIPAGVWHQHRLYGRSAIHTVGFGLDGPPLAADRPVVIAVDALVRELVIATTAADLTAAEEQRLRAVLHDRLPQADIRPLTLPTARDDRLARACALVTEDLGRPRSLAHLARRTGTAERTLSRLFRAEFGRSYPQWRTSVRVFHAMIALADGASVTATAHTCGWATSSAFVDTFARITGQTPGAYRAGRLALDR